MLQKSRGIVFRTTDYGETSIVAQIYTELFGIQSYIINSVRKKHARVHSNIFQPLTPVDLVVYHKERSGIQRISEIRPNPPLNNIPFDVTRSSMIFFLDEVLVKSIREVEANPFLFEFLLSSILRIDSQDPPGNNFHLVFLVKFSRFLGFFPQNNYDDQTTFFNLIDGRFQKTATLHPHCIVPPLSGIFQKLLSAEFDSALSITSNDRRLLLSYLIEYFELHIEGFGNIKSQKVLEEIWE